MSQVVHRCASEIEMEPVNWLWPGRVALGKHTCLAGEPGGGKSQLTIDLAARVSMGAPLPCGEGIAPQGGVIILSAEDSDSDTIVPRLHAAGADLGRVNIVKAVETDEGGRRGFSLQADLDALERMIVKLGHVRLVVIDPISSYLGRGIDSHRNSDVRGVLEPLNEMAERLGVAVRVGDAFQQSLCWQRAEGSSSLHWQHRLRGCSKGGLRGC
jgi:putative DNA primase/helicase